jgi:hypothetical protein
MLNERRQEEGKPCLPEQILKLTAIYLQNDPLQEIQARPNPLWTDLVDNHHRQIDFVAKTR